MKISVLASGSTGNCTYIEKGNFRCLIDVGLTGKKIEENLKKINKNIKDITHIFITHEHVDHAKSAGVLARKYKIPVYANTKTWQAMKIGEVPPELKCHFEKEETKEILGVSITSFGVSHDAADAQFYTIESEGKKFSIVTDTGYVSDKMIEYIKNSNSLVFESNHEESMLLASSYPWKTKQRILSDYGHISNTDSANYLAKIIGEKTKNIYLAHLSLENNTKDLAYITVKNILTEKGFDCEKKINLLNTDAKEPTIFTEV